MAWPFIFLAVAICFAWLPDRRFGRLVVPAWIFPFAVATLLGVYAGVVLWPGVAVLAVLVASASMSLRASGLTRHIYVILTIATALALALHMAPGFRNPKLFDSVRLSSDAAPFTQYLNFDKGAAGLVVLATFGAKAASFHELLRILRTSAPVVALTVLATVALGLVLHYVRVDPKVPFLTLAFLGANLFFTCVAEEAFFRGFLQERLMRFLEPLRAWRWVPVALSAFAFGGAHAGAGSMYLVLATVAGLGYAIAYRVTRRVEAPIAAHFAVNATQFLSFTYPYLVSS